MPLPEASSLYRDTGREHPQCFLVELVGQPKEKALPMAGGQENINAD